MIIKDMILNELNRIPDIKRTSKNMVMLCPYHEENTPSFNINIDETNRRVPVGHGYCLGCGASKSWNEIANTLGLKKIKKGEIQKENSVRKADPRIKSSLLGKDEELTYRQLAKMLEVKKLEKMYETEKWRGFSGRLLNKIKAKTGEDNFGNKCLILPVIVDGKIRGGIKALWEKPANKKIPKYLNMKGEWSRNYGLFLYDHAKYLMENKNRPYVFIVEGPRDALRLAKKGIPAVAILGTKSWSERKRNLIVELNAELVVIMMDADQAGIDATNLLYSDMKRKVNLEVIKTNAIKKKYKLKELDPGGCPTEILNKIIRHVEKKL